MIGKTYIGVGLGLVKVFLNPIRKCNNQQNASGSSHIYYTNERVALGTMFFHLSIHETLRYNKVLPGHMLLLLANNSLTKSMLQISIGWSKSSENTSMPQNNVSLLTENDIRHKQPTEVANDHNQHDGVNGKKRHITVVEDSHIRYWKYRKIPPFHSNPCKHH